MANDNQRTLPESHCRGVRFHWSLWGIVIALLILHQDYWQWDDATLDFGFLPRGMTYHASLSLVAATVWLIATVFYWPRSFDSADSEKESDA